MIRNRDTYATANLLVKRFGNDATIEAARRADELLEAGDVEGCATWKRILTAIRELQSEERPNSAKIH